MTTQLSFKKKSFICGSEEGDDDDKKGKHHMGQWAGLNETMTRYFIIMFSDLLKWISACKCCLHGYDQLNKKMWWIEC